MKRRFSIIMLLLASLSPVFAQENEKSGIFHLSSYNPLDYIDFKKFKHLDVSVSGGSTGVGVEVGSYIGDYVKWRVGFDFMPQFEKTINFGVQVGQKKPGQTDEEYAAESQSKFVKLADFLEGFTGQKVEDNVDMIGKPSFYNFKFLVDVYPFVKSESKFLKNCYVTAGFYWGNSKIAKAYNTTEDMPTLFSVNMYNGMYEKFSTDYYQYNDFFPGVGLSPDVINVLANKFGAWGRMGMHIGDYSHDGPQKFYNEDVIVPMTDEDGMDVYDDDGNMLYVCAHHKGDPVLDENGNPVLQYYKGDPYIMEPDEDCMVKARIKTNSFKPYLGIGYGTDLNASKSGWGVSVDAGVWFWGGSPSIVTHDGTDLVNDLQNVRGKVGRYTDLISKFKVYPVINLKITKRLF